MNTLTKKPTRNSGSLTRLTPWNRFFKNDWINLWDGDTETIPSVNIKEEKDIYKIELAAPGLKKEDFNIAVGGNILTISSEKKSESKEGNESDNYYSREYNYSSFERSLTLPDNVDADKITAKYNDGVLNVSVPKKPGSSTSNGRTINIQ
jgi:HSP20 family protein